MSKTDYLIMQREKQNRDTGSFYSQNNDQSRISEFDSNENHDNIMHIQSSANVLNNDYQPTGSEFRG